MKRLMMAALVAASLVGCSTSSPDVVRREDAQRLTQIQEATVLAVRPVVIDGSQSGAGGAVGGVIGGMAGSTVGGRREGVAGALLGVVAGAVVGNAIERSTTREEAVEITLQLRNGERRSMVQAKGRETFQPGDSVLLITTGNKVRLARAPAKVEPPPSLAAEAASAVPIYSPR